jgi:hypothetical protein
MSMYIEVSGAPRTGRWRQIVQDIVAAAPETDWARTVADVRVRKYDRIRPFVTRAALLAVVVATSAVLPGTRWWLWVMLVPAAVQIFLEILLEEPSNRDEEPELADKDPRRPLVKLQFRNHERLQVNATGVLGGPATVLVVLGQVFGTGPGGHGWVKVAGFAAALLYTNSAGLGPLVDVVVYSPLQLTPRWLRRSRPLLWAAVTLVAVAVVALAVRAGVWPAEAVPYAYLACAIPIAIGYRMREYERTVDCAGLVAAASISAANRRSALDLHNIVQPFKANVEQLLDHAVPGRERAELINFFAVMRAVHERVRQPGVDLQHGIMPPLDMVVRRSFGTTMLRPAPVLDLQLDDLDDDNLHFAQQVLTTLGDNAAQAYADQPTLVNRPLRIVARHQDGSVRVAVADALELIPEAVWNDPHRTVFALREDLEAAGGKLEQTLELDGGKTIVATWVPELRPLRQWHETDDDALGQE